MDGEGFMTFSATIDIYELLSDYDHYSSAVQHMPNWLQYSSCNDGATMPGVAPRFEGPPRTLIWLSEVCAQEE